MASRNAVTLTFAGDSRSLEQTFKNVGTEADTLAGDINTAAGRIGSDFDAITGNADSAQGKISGSFDTISSDVGALAGDIKISGDKIKGDVDGMGTSLGGLDGKVGDSVQHFRGFKDTIDGTTDIADGFRNGDVSQILGGFADLADGLATTLMPKLAELTDTLKNKITGAATAATESIKGLSASPTLASLGTFGLALAGILASLEAIDVLLEKILNLPEDAITGPFETIQKFLKDPGGLGISDVGKGSINTVKDFFGKFNPFHTGGVVPGNPGNPVPILAMAGETIIPAGQSAGGGIVVNFNGVVGDPAAAARQIDGILRQARRRGVIPA